MPTKPGPNKFDPIRFLTMNSHYLAWLVATTAVIGSMIFSSILHYPPCRLCWYQRIAMFPLMVILSVGILRKDKGVALYILPFSIAGSLIALYQTFLQWGWIPEKILACSADSVSCATKQFDFFGFITIPFLSLLAFLLITGLVWVYHLRSHE